jgi:2-methylcitrate dehydratase PrpD
MTSPSDAAETPAVTDHLARFIRDTQYDDVPAGVQDLAKGHILDALGLSLAGAATPGSAIINNPISSVRTL